MPKPLGNLFPLTKFCPELTKHLEISIDVDFHTTLVVVLEPESYNDTTFRNTWV